MASQSVANKILTSLRRRGAGSVFTPAEFLGIGSRAAVDKALSRLARSGRITRLARGIYVYPERSPLVGEIPPHPAAVARAIAKSQGATIQASGATSANALGLSTQVPAGIVYLTSGASKKYRVGKTVISFKHSAPRKLTGAGTAAGTVVQALRYLGPEGVNERVVQRLRQKLPPRTRRALRSISPLTPAWMRPPIERIAAEHA